MDQFKGNKFNSLKLNETKKHQTLNSSRRETKNNLMLSLLKIT